MNPAFGPKDFVVFAVRDVSVLEIRFRIDQNSPTNPKVRVVAGGNKVFTEFGR